MRSHQEVFDRQQGTGWWGLFGAPFLLAGITAMVASAFRNATYETGEPVSAVMQVVVFFVGVVFACIGAVFVFSRIGVSMNKTSGLISVWWGLIRPMKSTTARIEEDANVLLTRDSGESGESFQVSLRVADGDFELDSMRDYSDAREFAEEVALFLSVPLHDCSTGVETVLAGDEFHQSLRDRLRAAGAVHGLPEPPADCCVEHEWSDGRLTLEVPPPGMPWPMGVMMTVVLSGFLAFCAYSIREMAEDVPGFMVVLWGAALTVFFGGVLVMCAKEILMTQASERIVVSATGMETCMVSRFWSKRMRFQADEVEEVALLEEALEATSYEQIARAPKWARGRSHAETVAVRTRRRIHAFGRGLTREEAEWARLAIGRALAR